MRGSRAVNNGKNVFYSQQEMFKQVMEPAFLG